MERDFVQVDWDEQVEDDCRQLVRLAVREDLDRGYDWTTAALVPESAHAQATIVARQAGVVCGLRAAQAALQEMDADVAIRPLLSDGALMTAGTPLAELEGSARDLLTCERIVLNLVGRLCGVATLTRQFVDAVAGTAAQVYDTRKTTPGWRRLEKYAVRCGGGRNHRRGLYDAVLIKDNHLAFGAAGWAGRRFTPAEAVSLARQFLERSASAASRNAPGAEALLVEVEVDTLDQLRDVLSAQPDLVLLDNMTPNQLAQAVAIRDELCSNGRIPLEASGGVTLDTIREIAQSGVERISVGALTHAAISLDVSLDWHEL